MVARALHLNRRSVFWGDSEKHKELTMNKRGFVLIMVIVFLIVAAIASLGVYNAVYFVGKMQGIDEVRRVRGYYAASAGLNYANVILRYPANNPANWPLTKHVKTDYYPELWNDLGLTSSEDVVIKINSREVVDSGVSKVVGYDVTSTYTFLLAEEIRVAGFIPEFGFPKTGQTTSYPTGSATDRDDGHYQAGNPISPRFVDNNDGTITDNATGLMWVKDPSQIPGGAWGTPGNPKTMAWAAAITNCKVLDYAGHNDWRLPNIKALMSIVDYSEASPLISPLFTCSISVSKIYWSSTTSAYTITYAWNVNFAGPVLTPIALKTNMTGYVRPVRGGQ